MHSAANSRNSVRGFKSSNVGSLFFFRYSFGIGVMEKCHRIIRTDSAGGLIIGAN